ncbi:LPXTG cell wall anchor domain-containing protein [Mammaliicoccus sciuri]|nr:LPXTG cell wall anchor domain-containing protein [Mammaliicoccus sciuri]UXU94986.1 LPXTG cell wall anchor domain-containing protein [Mammaliicoccus sciuri]UXV16951.1 LPXTG cell wall anchor domain-containing protein [Mammaliicoccus sciuri]UXV25196.1 LPXTG cell wall anchor domain-containing protein [Mammaliicoccus sciuri]UXV28002.1 LPXTG cell wall anchor domain-containing protein [Mammaliicoccus sciuri]
MNNVVQDENHEEDTDSNEIKNHNDDKSSDDEKLPDTGETKQNSGLMSGLLAVFGGALLFRSRRKNNHDNQ